MNTHLLPCLYRSLSNPRAEPGAGLTLIAPTRKRRAAVIVAGGNCTRAADTPPRLCVVTGSGPERAHLLHGGLGIGLLNQ